jgi:hypothetical protein
VILGFSKTMGGTRLQEVASTLKAKNPNVKIAQYTVANEAKCEQNDPNQDTYAVTAEVKKNNWWLRNAAGERCAVDGPL